MQKNTKVTPQEIKATLLRLPNPHEDAKQRTARAVVADNDSEHAVFWIVDNVPDIDDKKGAFVYRYTVAGEESPALAGTINLPHISASNYSWKDDADYRPVRSPVINYLRIHNDFIWAADYNNGAIYRFKKDQTEGKADIIFYCPRKMDDPPYQFYDVAFQPKSNNNNNDRLWVGDGNHESTNIYYIDMPHGFDCTVQTPISDIHSHDISAVLPETSMQFCEMLCHNDTLWMMAYDFKESPENSCLITGTLNSGIFSEGSCHKVKNANSMAANVAQNVLYIGTTTGALYRKDISVSEKKNKPEEIHPAGEANNSFNPLTDHYRMSIDDAGYIWVTQQYDHNVNCYSPQGTLSRQYIVTANDSDQIWWSPATLLKGDRIVVADTENPQAGLFKVDAAFNIGNFDLKFDPPALSEEPDTTVSELPLIAMQKNSTDLYETATSATLSEPSVDKHIFPLPNEDLAVDIPPGQRNVEIPAPVRTGPSEGSVVIHAEARTTGNNHAELRLTVRSQNPIININNDIHIRQGQTFIASSEDTIIAAPNRDGTVVIDDSKNNTGTKFADEQSDKTQQTIKNINGKKVPNIHAGDTIGKAEVYVKVGNKRSVSKTIYVDAVPDTVIWDKPSAGSSPRDALKKTSEEWELTSMGSRTLKTDIHNVLAPKSWLRLTLHTPDDKVHFVVGDKAATEKTTVTIQTDENGKTTLFSNNISLSLKGNTFNPSPSASWIMVEYDSSGVMDNDVSRVKGGAWKKVSKKYTFDVSH